MYGYEDDLMNPFTLHFSRDCSSWGRLCNAVGHVQLEWYGTLVHLDMTGDTQVSILSDHLHPFMSITHSDGLGQFQQENALPYTSRITTEWIQEHSSGTKHLCWPPNSPDRNIIEHIWDAMQHGVQNRSPAPCTLMDLWIGLQDAWCQFPSALPQRLVKSLPCRAVALLHACRGNTQY